MYQLLAVRVLLAAGVILSVLDFFMSMFGMAIIFKTETFLGYVLCGASAFALLTLRLCKNIFSRNLKEMLFVCLFSASWLTIIVDGFIVLNSISVLIIGKQPLFEQPTMNWQGFWSQGEQTTKILGIIVIALLVFAPVALPALLREYKREKDKEYAAGK